MEFLVTTNTGYGRDTVRVNAKNKFEAAFKFMKDDDRDITMKELKEAYDSDEDEFFFDSDDIIKVEAISKIRRIRKRNNFGGVF